MRLYKLIKFKSKKSPKDKKDLFYFRVVAGNGKVVLASEGYATKATRDRAVEGLCRGLFQGGLYRVIDE